ncbi:hypothetical protein Dsin_007055 [Dipteronia sinensis]|uniref:Ubiquitin-like domain-containing protein n=1 Tax=Dipteronia sinensis TaxID=43782 RepID=A0AAE0B0F3_9ROSI|nr:hypothetical protein Dsin_007055 [Dipteronia sinensis]
MVRQYYMQVAVGKPKLILDLQDEQMLFEVLDNKDSKHLKLHAGAMIVIRSVEQDSAGSFELPGRQHQSDWQFNIANDKFSQQLQSNSNKCTAHGIRVHHSAPALKLQTMKLKLSNKDITYFHWPKALWYPHDNEVAVKQQGKLPTQGPMKIIVKSLGGKGSKLHVDAEENVSSIKTKASKKLDFKPAETVKLFYLGKELEDHSLLPIKMFSRIPCFILFIQKYICCQGHKSFLVKISLCALLQLLRRSLIFP